MVCGSLIFRRDLLYYSLLERLTFSKNGQEKASDEIVLWECGPEVWRLSISVGDREHDSNGHEFAPRGSHLPSLHEKIYCHYFQDFFQKRRDQIPQGPLSLIHHSYHTTILRGK